VCHRFLLHGGGTVECEGNMRRFVFLENEYLTGTMQCWDSSSSSLSSETVSDSHYTRHGFWSEWKNCQQLLLILLQ